MSVVPKKPMHKHNAMRKSLWYYLRYELIEDCLVKLFEYLHVRDLLNICDLDTEDDQYFTCIIRERVIGRKLIDFESLNWSFTKILETFGPFIKRLKITLPSDDVNYILGKIIAHSVPGMLIEVQFTSLISQNYADVGLPIRFDSTICNDLLQQAPLYFRNVKKIFIEDKWNILPELCQILLNLSNLKCLELSNVYSDEKMWTELITVDSMNVTELKVTEGSIYGDNLAKFIRKLPHLEILSKAENLQ